MPDSPMDVDVPNAKVEQNSRRSIDFFKNVLSDSSHPCSLPNIVVTPLTPHLQHLTQSRPLRSIDLFKLHSSAVAPNSTATPETRPMFSTPAPPPPPQATHTRSAGEMSLPIHTSSSFSNSTYTRRCHAADFFKDIQLTSSPATSLPPSVFPRQSINFLEPIQSSATNASTPLPIPPLVPLQQQSSNFPDVPHLPPITSEPSTSTSHVPCLQDSFSKKERDPRSESKARRKKLPDFPQFTFNTDDLLATRQTIRSWRGNRWAAEWTLSREELHAQQVDLDRELPADMDDTWFPSFAISPRDLESLHRYLMARYDILNLDEYKHLLALYRNTRAIEARNARQRFTDLTEARDSVDRARLTVVQRLQERHRAP